MKYMTKELWQQMNDEDESVCKAAEKQWLENMALYDQRMEGLKKKLPRRFLKNYAMFGSLHDYIIASISLRQRHGKKEKKEVEMQLEDGAETLLLTFSGVRAFRLSIGCFEGCVGGSLSWGFAEFSRTPQNTWQIDLLFDLVNEGAIEFETVRLEKQ